MISMRDYFAQEEEERKKRGQQDIVDPADVDKVATGANTANLQDGLAGANAVVSASGAGATTQGAVSGATTGATVGGSVGGAPGAAIGAVVGLVAGLLGGSAKRKKENKAIKAESYSNYYQGQAANQQGLSQDTQSSFRNLMSNYNNIF